MMASGSPGGHRPAVAIASGLSAALFAWAAGELPSRPGSPVALLLAGLALVHLGTLLVAVLSPLRLRWAWRTCSGVSLVSSLLLIGAIAVTAREMLQRFGSLGVGVASLLGVIGVLTLLATAPFAIWGLRATRGSNGAS
jgi:hypothetical protein